MNEQLACMLCTFYVVDDGSCIVENSPDNTIVRTFSTRELDTSPSNTDHVYEIESGGLNAAGDVSISCDYK